MTALHDPNVLPAELPAPQDDGAARHLAGMRLPSLVLAATDGSNVDLSKLSGRTVVYVSPRTGVPGQPLPRCRSQRSAHSTRTQSGAFARQMMVEGRHG